MKFAFLLSLLIFFQMTSANEVNLITYGGDGTTMSGEILLLIEDIINDPEVSLKSLKSDKGLAYRKGDFYLLSGERKESKVLDNVLLEDQLDKEKVIYVESSRSLMTFSKETPKKFLDIFRQKSSRGSHFQGNFRHWNDLTWNEALTGKFKGSEFEFIDFQKSSWTTDKNWKYAFFVSYELEFEKKKFKVTVAPKVYGGIERAINLIQSLNKKSPLYLGTGSITTHIDPTSPETLSIEHLNKLKEVYHLASYHEYSSLPKIIWPYLAKWKSRAPLNFLSANVYIKESDSESRVFSPYKVVERGGQKIAIIGLNRKNLKEQFVKSSSKKPHLKNLIVKDPGQILQSEILPKLRGQVDFIIALTDLDSEEAGQMMNSSTSGFEGVDMVIYKTNRLFNWRKKSQISMENYKKRVPSLPFIKVPTSNIILTQSDLFFNSQDIEIKLVSTPLDQRVDSGTDLDNAIESFADMFEGKNTVLPDHKKISSQHITIPERDFAHIAAEMMRREFSGEVGIFNIQPQDSNMIGDIDASVIKAWVKEEEDLVVTYLRGTQLLSIIKKAKTVRDPNKIVIVGVDNKNRINGSSINGNEVYKVITSSIVSNNKTTYPEFQKALRISNKFVVSDYYYYEDSWEGKTVNLADFIAKALEKEWDKNKSLSEAELIQKYKNYYQGKKAESSPGYWVHNFKHVRFEYSKLKTSDLTEFSNLQDSRLATADQTIITGDLSYAATYRKNFFQNESGIRAVFSEVELRPDEETIIENTVADDLVLFTNVSLPIFSPSKISYLATQMGPAIEIAFDSEFEKNENQETQRDIQGFFGWRFLNGRLIQDATLSALVEERVTENNQRSELGLNARFEIVKPFYDGNMTWRSDFDYRFFFRDSDDNNSDLRFRLIWDNYLDIKLYKNISFGPYFKYFHFKGKTFDRVGTQTTLGFNLNFSGLWKPKYLANSIY